MNFPDCAATLQMFCPTYPLPPSTNSLTDEEAAAVAIAADRKMNDVVADGAGKFAQ